MNRAEHTLARHGRIQRTKASRSGVTYYTYDGSGEPAELAMPLRQLRRLCSPSARGEAERKAVVGAIDAILARAKGAP